MGVNKPDIVEAVSKRTGVSRQDVRKVLDELFSVRKRPGLVVQAVESGKEVRLAGFGSFSMRRKAARPGKNPRTGEPIEVPERRYLVFRSGAAIRERFQAPEPSRKTKGKAK